MYTIFQKTAHFLLQFAYKCRFSHFFKDYAHIVDFSLKLLKFDIFIQFSDIKSTLISGIQCCFVVYVFASGFVYVVCLGTANCEFPASLPTTVKRCNETDAQLSFPSPSQHFTGQLLQSGTKLRMLAQL